MTSTRIVCANTWPSPEADAQAWWDEFVAEATARGDAARIHPLTRSALALQAQGYSPNMAVHTLF